MRLTVTSALLAFAGLSIAAPTPQAADTAKSKYSCPNSNGKRLMASTGANFLVECYVDRSGIDMPSDSLSKSSFDSCIETCASTRYCKDVSYVPETGACYLKATNGPPRSNGVKVWGARLVTDKGNGLPLSPTDASNDLNQAQREYVEGKYEENLNSLLSVLNTTQSALVVVGDAIGRVLGDFQSRKTRIRTSGKSDVPHMRSARSIALQSSNLSSHEKRAQDVDRKRPTIRSVLIPLKYDMREIAAQAELKEKMAAEQKEYAEFALHQRRGANLKRGGKSYDADAALKKFEHYRTNHITTGVTVEKNGEEDEGFHDISGSKARSHDQNPHEENQKQLAEGIIAQGPYAENLAERSWDSDSMSQLRPEPNKYADVPPVPDVDLVHEMVRGLDVIVDVDEDDAHSAVSARNNMLRRQPVVDISDSNHEIELFDVVEADNVSEGRSAESATIHPKDRTRNRKYSRADLDEGSSSETYSVTAGSDDDNANETPNPVESAPSSSTAPSTPETTTLTPVYVTEYATAYATVTTTAPDGLGTNFPFHKGHHHHHKAPWDILSEGEGHHSASDEGEVHYVYHPDEGGQYKETEKEALSVKWKSHNPKFGAKWNWGSEWSGADDKDDEEWFKSGGLHGDGTGSEGEHGEGSRKRSGG